MSTTITTPDKSRTDAEHCIIRFKALQEHLKQDIAFFKLRKFILGMEVQTLCDLHHEIYGETRGRRAADEINDGGSFISLTDWLEEKLEVTYRTATRYRSHFTGCVQAHPKIADKLIKWWDSWKDKAIILPELQQGEEAPAKGKGKGKDKQTQLATVQPIGALSLLEASGLVAEDIQAMLNQPDEWGLHELFEVPVKDVTPETGETPAPNRPDPKEAAVKFWLHDFQKRALKDDFLKLPKTQRESLLTTFKEAAVKLEDSLKSRKAKA